MSARRRYDASGRERRAALTRQQIALTAVEQFVAQGYATTFVRLFNARFAHNS